MGAGRSRVRECLYKDRSGEGGLDPEISHEVTN